MRDPPGWTTRPREPGLGLGPGLALGSGQHGPPRSCRVLLLRAASEELASKTFADFSISYFSSSWKPYSQATHT